MQDKRKELQIALGKTVKALRKDISINRLAHEIDLSKSIWSELEKGRKDIQLSTLWKIAEALEVSPSELLRQVELSLEENFSFIETTI